MKKKVVIVMKQDIVSYPPVLSLINVLLDLQYEVIYVGTYSDAEQKKDLINRGVSFCSTVLYKENANWLIKLFLQLKFRKQATKYLNQLKLTKDDFVWIVQAETVCLLSSLVNKYQCVFHFLEYISISWKYRLLNPFFSMKKTIRKAVKIVCCEYNRAQIAKGMFQLDRLPYILPNKPYFDEKKLQKIPIDIQTIVDNVRNKTMKKKVVLYQGIFINGERRLEEFCQAIKNMPDEYMLLVMGKTSPLYEELKQKYASEKILFIPFIRPPFHLLITCLASIGVLSYFPRPMTIASVLNPLFCAPNKIFEYAKYGIPMIANDIPGLRYIFLEHKCGECIPDPMSVYNIEQTILSVFRNYESYSKGAIHYYDSVDIKHIIANIMELQ